MFLAAASAGAGVWPVLFQLAVLLAAALVVGMLFERFGQSAILGYLLAGMLLGPGVLSVIDEGSGVPVIAELGVSLLLFAIGLEFSARRLLRLGPVAVGGGTIQVVATMGLAASLAMGWGLSFPVAVALGATVALSSTASVLRVLADRAELDSVHGRTSLGILLLQDVAVVPLVLLVAMLAGEDGVGSALLGLARATGLIVALVGVFFLLTSFVLPRMMRSLSLARDRELLVLLSVVLAMGSALAAHALGLSPALGAFLAGMMLAESPFATQIRSDIGGLRIVFITLFFASVGMLGQPAWIAAHAWEVGGVTILLMTGKAAVIAAIGMLFRLPARHAIATGITLAQVGEFGIVIAGIAQSAALMDDHLFRLVVSATLASLFVTPLLTRSALPIATALTRLVRPGRGPDDSASRRDRPNPDAEALVVVVGFGPSGQKAAERARELAGLRTLVIDMRPANIDLARSMGIDASLGDATNIDFLIHHGIDRARAIVIALPDHRTSMRVVESVRTLNSGIVIVARARYHSFVEEMENAGVSVAVDEEHLTGRAMQEAVSMLLADPFDRRDPGSFVPSSGEAREEKAGWGAGESKGEC